MRGSIPFAARYATARSVQSDDQQQALTAMLPALIGQFVVILKDSALGYQVLYQELLTWSKTLGSAFSNTVPAYIVCGLLFILINYTLSKLAGLVQRRLSRRGRAVIATPGADTGAGVLDLTTPISLSDTNIDAIDVAERTPALNDNGDVAWLRVAGRLYRRLLPEAPGSREEAGRRE